jgi:putative SOS response-associated peptidase YedK
LVPHWAKDPKSVRQPINARAETLARSPLFRDALERRRCLVPADVFYEWQTGEGGKLPFAVRRADGDPVVFAGLWEGWRGTDSTVIRSFTIVTTEANALLRPIHERMPVILERADWPVWLGEVEGEAPALLRPSKAELHVWLSAPIGSPVARSRGNRTAVAG